MNIEELLSYCPTTGELRLKVNKKRTKVGEIATTEAGRGYLKFEWKGKKYYAHRLAWLLHYGEWPPKNVDHINGDKGDNRIANLRLCDHKQNGWNRPQPSHNTSGFTGVYFRPSSCKWYAQISVNRRKVYLGEHVKKYDAIIARKQAERRHFGKFRHGAVQALES
jgi:hypothetical protein